MLALALACDARAPSDSFDARAAAVPDLEFCDDVRVWPSAADEAELLAAITRARAAGGSCGALGRAAPTGELRESGALSCAARVHALDMATREFFDHEDPDGRLPWDRIADAGYSSVLATELIAHGDVDPIALVEDLWLPSDPHCGALLAGEWLDIGLARHELTEPPPDADTPAPTWWVVVLAVARLGGEHEGPP